MWGRDDDENARILYISCVQQRCHNGTNPRQRKIEDITVVRPAYYLRHVINISIIARCIQGRDLTTIIPLRHIW